MIEIDRAVAAVHQKEMQVRTACAEFDHALVRMKRALQLSPDRDAWLSTAATRLSVLNKQYRISTKNDLQALSTCLRQTYGNQPTFPTALAHLEQRAQDGNVYSAEAQALLAECEDLYKKGVEEKTLAPMERVELRRSLPRLRPAIEHVTEQSEDVKGKIRDWKVFFEILTSEEELAKILENLHARKLTKTAASEKAEPVFQRLLVVCGERDAIIFAAHSLALSRETQWLSYRAQGISEQELHGEMQKFDALLDRAAAQRPVQIMALKEAEALLTLARSPVTLPGPDGVELSLGRLREAYTQFHAAEIACDAVLKLIVPVCETLRNTAASLRKTPSAAVKIPSVSN